MAEPSLTIVRRFRASPQALFDACTDPAKLCRWFGPADFAVTHLEADARPGGRLLFRMEGPGGPVAAEGVFQEVAAPRRVALTWRWTEGPPEAPPQGVTSLVTFDIAPDGEGSRLTLTHAGYRDGPAGKTHEEGWSEAADKLARLLHVQERFMAELFIQIAVSLDGHVEGRGGDLDWFVVDDSIDPTMTETLRGIDGMILGRKAHALLARFWPMAGEGEASPDLAAQARLMNALPKYVLTHGAERTGWANSHAIGLHDIPRLKAQARRPLALYAGAEAARAALAAGHVDEVRLITYPVLLGAGTPLFVPGGPRLDLRLESSESFASGAVLNRYRVEKEDPDHA